MCGQLEWWYIVDSRFWYLILHGRNTNHIAEFGTFEKHYELVSKLGRVVPYYLGATLDNTHTHVDTFVIEVYNK